MQKIVLKQSHDKEHTLIMRFDEAKESVYEYIVAYKFNEENKTWESGTYFFRIDDALNYFNLIHDFEKSIN